MTFTQLSERLKNFLRGWLLVLGLKEGLVECATVCVKSVVILLLIITMQDTKANLHSCVTTALMVKATTMNTNTIQTTAPPLLKHAYVLLTARVAKGGMKSADL